LLRSIPAMLIILWWPLWLLYSLSSLSPFRPPTGSVVLIFGLASLFFALGFLAVNLAASGGRRNRVYKEARNYLGAFNVLALLCCSLLLLSLIKAGAFTNSHDDYWALARVEYMHSNLTGYGMLDTLTVILVYPLLYLIQVAALTVYRSKLMFVISSVGCLFFAYLWQVNYPIIYSFYIAVFAILIRFRFEGMSLYIFRGSLLLVIIVAFLAFSASFRYGEFGLEALNRYFINYQIMGLSIFSEHFHDSKSLIHQLSWGTSSAGVLETVFYVLANGLGLDYSSAVLANNTELSARIDIGLTQPYTVNAFGTLLFTFYRDAGLAGCLFFPFIYGFVTGVSYVRSGYSDISRAIFTVLGASWVIGLMVSPVERPYFWVSLLGLVFLGYAQRMRVS
jgi:hypothetical protein